MLNADISKFESLMKSDNYNQNFVAVNNVSISLEALVNRKKGVGNSTQLEAIRTFLTSLRDCGNAGNAMLATIERGHSTGNLTALDPAALCTELNRAGLLQSGRYGPATCWVEPASGKKWTTSGQPIAQSSKINW